MLAGGPISWKSHKQQLTTTSTMMAEYVAMYNATCHGMLLRNLIAGLKVVNSISSPLKLYCDNSTAVNFSNGNSSIGAGLYLDIKYLFVRERVEESNLCIEYISTKVMLVDPMTKGLPPKIFEEHVTYFKCGGVSLGVGLHHRVMDGSSAIHFMNTCTFEILSGHVWKCVSIARGLLDDQETKLMVAIDGRARLQPQLPPGYFGNVVFTTVVIATAGDIQSKSPSYVSTKIHDALVRMNNDYLKSSVNYLEQHLDVKTRASYKYSNIRIISWARLPIHDADFGWGRPTHTGPTWIPLEGLCFVLPSPKNDGSLSIIIVLEVEQMKVFSNLLYAI
ncbi:hypothetical protein E3N88_26096 [Mikania micrantha]|uniref:Uncharacterized protein n=1 Tax=Mikania micrantha TaxID=192012 RepID=A0A5N6N748_9ASTR|nr:hypothetical protein E3N88_26096 [Mikania micrantha]